MQHVKVKRLNGVVVLIPRGHLVGGEETDQLQTLIRDLAAEDNKHLVINLAETQYISSPALGVLVMAHTNYAKRNGQLKLCCIDKRITSLFMITKLSLVFDVYESEDKAIASFATGNPSST